MMDDIQPIQPTLPHSTATDDIESEQIAGTADEVDVDAGTANLKLAPSPSRDGLYLGRNGELELEPSYGGAGQRTGTPTTTVDVSTGSSTRTRLESSSLLGPDGIGEEGAEEYTRASEEEDNTGSQSPARKILELPPALDLSEGVEVDRDEAIMLQAGGSSDNNGVGLHDRSTSFMEDVPLTPLDTAQALDNTGTERSSLMNGLSIDTSTGDLDPQSYEQQDSREQPPRGPVAFRFAKHAPRLDDDVVYPPSPAQEQATTSLQQQQQQQAQQAQQGNQQAQGQGQAAGPSGPESQPLPPPPPPPKQPIFAYHHDDTDSTEKELEEFFSYVEVRGVVEDGREAWSKGWEDPSQDNPEWPDAPLARKKAHIYHIMEQLEHREPEIRLEAARRIAYIAQGTPIYSTSLQHHLHLVVSNCTLLRECGALSAVHEALKSAGGRWNVVSSMPESDVPHYSGHQQQQLFPSLTPQERQEYLEEINGELAIHLSALYFLLETCRGDEGWADELMALDPPLPIYLVNLVAGLREKNAKGYPVKKLLLLLWKALLACLGGDKDIKRVKKLVRTIEGLPDDAHGSASSLAGSVPIQLKATPLDFTTFKGEIISKYPAYEPPPIVAPIAQVPLERISAAAASAPLRNALQSLTTSSFDPPHQTDLVQNPQPQQPVAGPLPPTPAPSPPPSPLPPKPKKQQYQTDQTKPFVLPFSNTNLGGGHYASIKGKGKMTVPFSIDEAGKLYKRNIRITTELWQSWKLREEFLADENGADGHEDAALGSNEGPQIASLSKHFETLSFEESMANFTPQVDPSGPSSKPAAAESRMDALGMLYQFERKLRDELKAKKRQDADEDSGKAGKSERKTLTQKIKDVKKLQRVEIIYRSTLPNMQSAIIVLLKLLLATVTANNNANAPAAEGEPLPPQSLEETDIMRHREITSKAVSAILILTLRWFKASHAMKFHYLAHLLVDSNCLLLILKMFGLQEVSNQVRMRNEVEEWNFFHFCQLYASRNPSPARLEDSMLEIRAQPVPALNEDGTLQDPDEPEIITTFSWRNFFSVINFVHILQKLTKRKPHRILLLVQYKSSAILKRILKVSHPILQLYVLKVIKSQVPYCGRKWRQSNMKVITAIYLNCRPDLRDEWLTTIDVDTDLDDSLPHEQTLRTLVRFFNAKHYSAYVPQLHHRTSSHFGNSGNGFQVDSQLANGHIQPGPSQPGAVYPALPSPSSAFYSPGQGFFEGEIFPPARPLSAFGGDDHYRTSYIPDSLMDGYLEDYEDMLGDFFTPVYDAQGMPIPGAHSMAAGMSSTGMGHGSPGLVARQGSVSPGRAVDQGWSHSMGPSYLSSAEQAWHRLGEILGDADSISDSESVASIGLLDVGGDSDGSDLLSEDGSQQGRSDWDHLSPDLASALEEEEAERAREERKSPHRRRRSASPHSPRLRRTSSGTPRSPALRPVLVDVDNPDYEDGDSAVHDEDDDGDDEDDDDGPPYPISRSPRRSPHLSPQRVAIDEVEAFFSS